MKLRKIFSQGIPNNKLKRILMIKKIEKYCNEFIKNPYDKVDVDKLNSENRMFISNPDLIAKEEDIVAVKYNLKAPNTQIFKDAMKNAYINNVGHSFELVNSYIEINNIPIEKLEKYKEVELIYENINRNIMETSIAKTCFYDYLALRVDIEKEKRIYSNLKNNEL